MWGEQSRDGVLGDSFISVKVSLRRKRGQATEKLKDSTQEGKTAHPQVNPKSNVERKGGERTKMGGGHHGKDANCRLSTEIEPALGWD